MPRLKTYDLFLSHAWKYNRHYYNLVEMLKGASNFYFRNYSVPSHDPVIDPNTIIGKKKLINLLDKQVRPVNCVLIIGGMYAAHSEWIKNEIQLAQRYNKPIIGVYTWGQERMPKIIQNSAIEIVKWNTSSIVSAVRKYSI